MTGINEICYFTVTAFSADWYHLRLSQHVLDTRIANTHDLTDLHSVYRKLLFYGVLSELVSILAVFWDVLVALEPIQLSENTVKMRYPLIYAVFQRTHSTNRQPGDVLKRR